MGKYKNNKEERLSIYTYSMYMCNVLLYCLFFSTADGNRPESKRVAVFLASSSRRRAEGRGA